MSGVKVSGKVKWFNNAKGFGFINEDGQTEDLFAHYSAIQMGGYKTLKAGQEVYFELLQGPKGLHAIAIQDKKTVDDAVGAAAAAAAATSQAAVVS